MSSISLSSYEVNNSGTEVAEFVKEVESFLSDLISRKKVSLEEA